MEVIHLIQYGRVHKLFINNDKSTSTLSRDVFLYQFVPFCANFLV
jgi:hypothetical protein